MIAYRDYYNKGKDSLEVADSKRRERIAEHYFKLNLSPIYTTPEFELIPRFQIYWRESGKFETRNNSEKHGFSEKLRVLEKAKLKAD